MAKDMAALVANMQNNRGSNSKAKEYARASEWPTCSHAGCPLQTTIKADTVTCSYHYREHGYSAKCITESVVDHEYYLKKYTQMIHWNVRQWRDKKHQIMGWDVLPATEIEMDLPTLYLTRFKNWIDKSIKEKAEEIYKNGQ